MADSELAPKFAPFIGMAGICAAVSYSHSPFRPLPRKQLTHSNFIRWFLDEQHMEPPNPALALPVLEPFVINPRGNGGYHCGLRLSCAVLIAGGLGPPPQKTYSLYTGFMHLAAGLSVGLSGLAAGYTIGVVGDVVSYENPGAIVILFKSMVV
ncbi:vacuolar ATP synthase subunit C [Histoplasma capsulatum H143]|uniref:Vacuolar ATP synthase subunit C n=1 Tax=Ajellomyces capsulatus (strain H143) TaxID=544712 RepID=C6HFN9_AJECH|nr:vacuolar ATP synthase subunit C [Histoplasma capsulatum H143]